MRPIALAAALAFPTLAAAITPSEALKLAPGSYNTVTVVNVASLLKTPRAVREKWAERDHTEYLAGAIPFHPSVTSIVSTTELKPGSKSGGSHAVMVPTAKPVDLVAVAKAVGGEVTTLGDEPAVVTRGGLYLIKLADQVLGGMGTEHRQDVGRWVRAVKEKRPAAAGRYLTRAIGNLGPAHVQILVDVADMYSPKDVAGALSLSPLAKADAKATERVARYLSGLQGVRLLVTVEEKAIRLAVILDGSEQPGVPAELLKDVVVELVERTGAGLTDLRAAVAKAEVNSFSLTLNVTDEELSYITALVLPPLPSGDLERITVASGEVTREATARYVAAADRVVADLKRKSRSADDYFRTAMWHDAAARRLATLSVLGVDKAAVEYAYGAAGVLHAIGESLHGVPLQAAQLEQQAYYFDNTFPKVIGFPGWGWTFTPIWTWGFGTVDTNLPEIRQKQLEVIRKDRDNRAKLWEVLDSKRSELTGRLKAK
jgi:hypothetical protein